jgi:Uma2 family endonuclease
MTAARSAIIVPVKDGDDIDDYLARGEDERIELIRGAIVEKAEVLPKHGITHVGTSSALRGPFQRKPGGTQPGGWWFMAEQEIQFGEEIFRPDLCGYRRERMPEVPEDRILTLPPDWVCEILSPSNVRRDRVEKLQTYFAHRVPHYWIIDPSAGTLEVFRRTDLAYALVLTAQRGQRVRAEPFDAVELSVGELLGDDPE